MERFHKKLDAGGSDRIFVDLCRPIKQDHWIWWGFPIDRDSCPDIVSETTRLYSMNGIEEAQQFMLDPILGAYYSRALDLLINSKKDAAAMHSFFGHGDLHKFRSHLYFFQRALLHSPLLTSEFAQKIILLQDKCMPSY